MRQRLLTEEQAEKERACYALFLENRPSARAKAIGVDLSTLHRYIRGGHKRRAKKP